MIGWIKDLPDWSIGALLGGAAWYGVSYAALAPRAMENDLVSEVYPACMAQLGADQESALSKAEDRKRSDAEYERKEALKTLHKREADLSEMKTQLSYYNSMRRTYRDSGLGALIPLPQVEVPSAADIERSENALRKQRAALKLPIVINLPRAPSAALMKTCSCAALQALTGARSDYAVSMASFRLIAPTDVSSLKQDVAQVIRVKSCGDHPWEKLS